LFPDVGPRGTVLLRLGLSAVLLLAVARPRMSGHRRSDLGRAVLFGLVLAGMNATFYEALSRIPLGLAVTIEFAGPLAVAILGSRRRLDLLWVALAAAGVALLSSGDTHADAAGVVLALVAGAFWAAYILLAKGVGAVFPGATGLAIGLTAGTLAVLPFGIAQAGSALAEPRVLGLGLAVAVLSSAVPYTLELFALRRMRASVFGVLMSLEPAVAAVSGLLFLHQHLTLAEWLAVVCVMSASVGATAVSRAADVPVDPGATPTPVAAA
jgi:inner membrane transporter RhtA